MRLFLLDLLARMSDALRTPTTPDEIDAVLAPKWDLDAWHRQHDDETPQNDPDDQC